MADLTTQALPAPRLQLRWERSEEDCMYPWRCHYELVLPLGKHDIRREVYGDDGELVGEVSEVVAALKPPTRRGGSDCVPCSAPNGSRYCDAPYRDGAHAQWDAAALGGLPIYVIAPDGMAFRRADAGQPAQGGGA